jgi:hypothetical protein
MIKPAANDLLTLKLHYGEIKALIDILIFAKSSAKVLTDLELKKGFGTSAANRMSEIARDAQELHHLLVQYIQVGEPEDDEVH